MKDIKLLYENAKNTGRESDINDYTEAVHEALKTNPNDYFLQLEYIISSDIGLQTLDSFVESWGLPICAFDKVMSLLEKCSEKCKKQDKDESPYAEAMNKLNAYKNEFKTAFDMYEYYSDDLNVDAYIKEYYSITNDIQHRILPAHMVRKFQEAAVADTLITGINRKSLDVVLEMYKESSGISDPKFMEWVTRSTKDHVNDPLSQKAWMEDYQHSASYIYDNMKQRNESLFRESVIMGNENAMYEYTEEEIESIKDLIDINEFVLAGCEDYHDIIKIGESVQSLYNELDGMIFESTEDDVPEDYSDEKLVPVYGIVKHYDVNRPIETAMDKWNVGLAKQLKMWTKGDNYSHALVSLDDDFKEVYSFEKEGIVRDKMEGETWERTDSIYVCALFVRESELKKMRSYCKNLEAHPDTTVYQISNVIKQYTSKPVKDDKRLICSTFTGYVLGMADQKNLHRDYSRLRPEDITILPRSFYIGNYKNITEFKAKIKDIKKRTKEIFDENKEAIEDYNNQLPKLMLQNKFTELKSFDKIMEFFYNKCFLKK